MDIRPLSPDFAVGPQITLEEIDGLRRLGFRSLLSNRPDGEEAGQPAFAEVAAAGRRAGLEVRHLPVVPGAIGPQDARDLRQALDALPAPVFAFCRSGGRAAQLWRMAQD